MKSSKNKRTVVRRVMRWFGVLVLVAIGLMLVDGWRGFGHRATGARRARMERSPQWQGGHFVNPQPLVNDWLGVFTGILHTSTHAFPQAPLSVATVEPRRLSVPPVGGLRLVWFGHSSVLIDIDGVRVLTDPVWSERVGPISWLGPSRYYPPPVALRELPAVDAVVISHDHYDHLDHRTIIALRDSKTRFIVPLGIGAHLEYWGIPAERIVELDWWERTEVGALQIVCTPARHAAGRMLLDNDAKLWGGFALVGSKHRVYYSGDTGLFPGISEIGERLGPFDVTLIEIGQYHRTWPDWHIGPEQAVAAHKLVKGRLMLPVHWALVTLAYHGWTEPMERVLAAAQRSGVTVLTARPGEFIEPAPAPAPAATPWWPNVSWETAAQHPIISTWR